MLIDLLAAVCREMLDHSLLLLTWVGGFLSVQVAVGLMEQLSGSLRTYLGN